MDATTTPPSAPRMGLPLLGCALALVCVALVPSLSLPLAMVMPLVVCPGRITTGLWFSLLMPLIPGVGLIWSGAPWTLALLSLSFSYLSLLASLVARRQKLDLYAAAFWQAGAMLVSLALLCWQVAHFFGKGLLQGLAEYVTTMVAQHPNVNGYLFSLVEAGFFTLPDETDQLMAALFRQDILVMPAIKTELLSALRFFLFEALRQWIPGLLVQLSLTVGLFTALFTAREKARSTPQALVFVYQTSEGEIKSGLPLPSFRGLYLPAPYRQWVLGLSILALLLAYFSRGEALQFTSAMMISAVTTLYALLGAAVWVFLLCRKRPKAALFAGITGGILFLLYPVVLMALGLADQFLHLRAATLLMHKNKEE